MSRFASRIAALKFEIDYLDSTTPSLRELNKDESRALIEERAELIWREANPDNTAGFRIALDGAPLRFTEGGGRYCFSTRTAADACRDMIAADFKSRGWPNEINVVEFAPFEIERDAPVLAEAA